MAVVDRLCRGPANVDQAGGLSTYGVMGMNGNAWELEETERDLVNDTSPSFRGVRGGGWFNDGNSLSSSSRVFHDSADGVSSIGFRVASIAPFACGDFDTDLDVDSADLVSFLTDWTGSSGAGRGDTDLSFIGPVRSAQLNLTELNLTVVPEPGSVALLFCGASLTCHGTGRVDGRRVHPASPQRLKYSSLLTVVRPLFRPWIGSRSSG